MITDRGSRPERSTLWALVATILLVAACADATDPIPHVITPDSSDRPVSGDYRVERIIAGETTFAVSNAPPDADKSGRVVRFQAQIGPDGRAATRTRRMENMKAFACTMLVAAVGSVAQSPPITEEGVRRHVETLAADSMRGRGSPSVELDRAAAYVAGELARRGVKPVIAPLPDAYSVAVPRRSVRQGSVHTS